MKFQSTGVQLFASCTAIRYHAQKISWPKDVRNVSKAQVKRDGTR